jgi:hypothetical protein
MRELELVGVTDEGHLVLAGGDDQQFRLAVDDRVRAAVRGETIRFAQLQIRMETTVRPREIQARVRAGQTAEEIAAEAGVPVEAVRRFEGPILAERAWMAQQARSVVPHRSAGQTSTLSELVAHRLAQRGLDAESVSWDAWRGDEAVWTVQARFTSGKAIRGATWRFDPARRSVTPIDEDALWLTEGEDALAVASGRRLIAVGAPADEDSQRVQDEHLVPVGEEPAPVTPEVGGPSGEDTLIDRDAADPRPGEEATTGHPDEWPQVPAAGRGRARARGRRASVPSWDDILLGTRRPD